MHLAKDRPVIGSCEHGIEPSDSVTDGEFLDQLTSQFFRDYASWSWLPGLSSDVQFRCAILKPSTL
jgi:hypothetical protein